MEKEITIVAVDFDCTLTKNDAYPFAGEANDEAFDILKEYKSLEGRKLILWTCRTGEALQNALNLCSAKGLEFDAVNENIPEATRAWKELNPGVESSRKIFAHMYIDDRDPHALLHGIDWDAVRQLLLPFGKE